MKNTEAIKWLKAIKEKYIHGGDEWYDSKRKEAIDCAITVLGGEVKTYADRIRSMSDEKLADWLARTQIANVAEALAVASIPYELEDGLKDETAKECLEWLKQPAEEERTK